MGALPFYIGIFFLGYFASHGLNLIARRILINRRIAGLICVFIVAIFHGYKIVTSPLPATHDTDATYALGYYVFLPVAVIVGVFLYITWQEKRDQDSQ